MTAPRLLALDLSLTSTGVASTHDDLGRPRLGCATIRPRTDGHQRLQDICTGVAAALRSEPQLVLIERLPHVAAHSAGTTMSLAELHGLVKQHLWISGVPYLLIQQARIKTYATGHGNAPKRDVLRAAQSRYPVYVGTTDEADALALLALACHGYGYPLADVPDTHSRAMRGITWPTLPPPPGGAHMAAARPIPLAPDSPAGAETGAPAPAAGAVA